MSHGRHTMSQGSRQLMSNTMPRPQEDIGAHCPSHQQQACAPKRQFQDCPPKKRGGYGGGGWMKWLSFCLLLTVFVIAIILLIKLFHHAHKDCPDCLCDGGGKMYYGGKGYGSKAWGGSSDGKARATYSQIRARTRNEELNSDVVAAVDEFVESKETESPKYSVESKERVQVQTQGQK